MCRILNAECHAHLDIQIIFIAPIAINLVLIVLLKNVFFLPVCPCHRYGGKVVAAAHHDFLVGERDQCVRVGHAWNVVGLRPLAIPEALHHRRGDW